MYKKILAIMLLPAILFLAACGGGAKPGGEYGGETRFDGPAHSVSVLFVNVGKADSAIVNVDGHFWLIDAGNDDSLVDLLSALSFMGASNIDGVILTHEHSDHIGGLFAVAQSRKIGRVVCPGLLLDNSPIEEMLTKCSLTGSKVVAGDVIPVTDGVCFEVLAPVEQDPEDDNDNSLVVMLRVNGRSFLFTGDMQMNGDARLLASGADIKCDVLKVPNHGNPDAVSAAFANAASPKIAVISTSTSVDTDSANRMVRAKLSMADCFVTEDYALGVLVTVSSRGVLSVSFPERQAGGTVGAELSEADKSTQSVKVVNRGSSAVDLSGCFIWSTKGYEVFVFPEGTLLPAGAELLIASRNSSLAGKADYIWNEKKVWAANKEDWAVLCDRLGNELTRLRSE